MLIGNWRNIEDLEEALNLEELKLILESYREQQLRHQKFLAALQGVDLDKARVIQAQEDFKKIQQRVEARKQGISPEAYEMHEIGFEVEEGE